MLVTGPMVDGVTLDVHSQPESRVAKGEIGDTGMSTQLHEYLRRRRFDEPAGEGNVVVPGG